MVGIVSTFRSQSAHARNSPCGRRCVGLLIVFGVLTALHAALFGADVTVFGPQTYNGNGRPVLQRRTFKVATGGDGYTLRVTNRGVIAALIVLNGRIVLRPSDFIVVTTTSGTGQGSDGWESEWGRLRREWRSNANDRAVPLIEKPVTLRTGNNEIVVAFIGPVGTSFTLEIVKPGTADTTPPVITTNISPAPNGNTWNRTPVTVTFTCTDADSGVATCPAPVTVSSEGAKQLVSGTAVDKAGNTATASVTLNIDLTAPTVAATQSPSANANGWNNVSVVVSFTALDALSGVAPGSLSAPFTLSADGTNLSASGQATDLAGNVGSVTHTGINIDRTFPAGTVGVSPPPNGNGWNSGPITASFTCTDSGSGIGTCPPDQVVGAEGASQTVTGTATDIAGNSATITSAPFSIDRTPPSITVALSPAPNASGIYTGPVTAHFSCADALSGVASCPSDQVVTTAGSNQTVTGTATDRAGNSASVTSPPFTIELATPNRAPTASAGGPYAGTAGVPITFDASGSSDPDGDTLQYEWTFGDGGSGSGATPSHTYTGAGTFEATVTVSDGRGGTATASAQAVVTAPQPAVLSLTITEPAAGRTVPTPSIAVRGTISDPTARVVVQNQIASVSGTTWESRNIALFEGSNQILVRATTTGGAQATATLALTLDSIPPALTVFSPPDRSMFTATSATVSAIVSDATALTCSINGAPVTIQTGLLSSSVALASGRNEVSISCQDAAGHTSSRILTLFQDAEPLVTIAVEPADGATGVLTTAPIEIRFSEPVDPATVTSGTVIVRAGNMILPVNVSVSPDGLLATVTPVVPFPQGTEILITVTNGVKDATGNPIAVPFIAAFTTEGTAMPPGVVIGEVYDDRRSLPLGGATVEALDKATRQVLATTETDGRGKYLLDPGQTNFLLRISKPGFTSVERATADSRGSFAEAMDARLTAKSEPRIIQALLGGTVTETGGDAVVIPPGAFDVSTNVSVTLTSISGQGPIAVFPPGWAPLSIVDLEAPEGPPFPATLKLVDRSQMASGRNATLARYDKASASWLALTQVVVPVGTPLELSEPIEPGQFALLVPDEGAGAPGAALRGQPLPSSAPGAIPVDAQATGEVNPPVGRADDPTPAQASIDITSPTPLRSGTLLRGDFMEVIMLRGGGQVSPLDTSQDFVSYRSLEDASGLTLVASFPIAPSRVFNPADVTDGSITVRLSRGETTAARSVIGTSGGGVSAGDGSRVIVPSGALSGDVPVDLRRLDSTTFPITTAPNVTFVGGLELNLSSVTASLPLMLSLSGSGSSVSTGSTVIVAEVRNVKGVERLVIVALAQVDGSDLTSVPRIGGIDLAGIRQSGRYGFFRFDGALGAVSGTARDEAGRRNGHVAELVSMPFVSITDNDGRFVLAAQPGSFDLMATAAASGDQARASGTTGTPLPEIVIGPTPPRVEEITVRLAQLEGDFAGPIALLGNPAPVVDDDSSGSSTGNGNGQIEAGEQIELTLFVRNDGTIPIQGGFFVLDVRGPPGPIQAQPANIPLVFMALDEPIAVGPFVFSVPAGTNPALLRYRLAYANNGGLANLMPFSLPLGVEHPNAPPASDITIRFSEPVVRSSLDAGVTLSREDGTSVVPVNTALVVASDNRSLILRPLTPLSGDTVYRITLTSQIVDADGRALANAPHVERLRTEDRTPPPVIPAGQVEASVPDQDGFVTITGSPGSVNPDDIVIGLNATTGFSALANVGADGSFTVRIRADVTDDVTVIIRDRNHNSTTVDIGALIRRDPITGRVLGVVVGRSGGTVSTEPGIRLIVPVGAVQSATELSAVRLSAPFQLPADLLTNTGVVAAFNARFSVVDRVRITSNVTRFAGPIRLSLTAPQGAAAGDRFVVWRSQTVTFGGPLADLDLLTGIPLADSPIVTAERLEIVESATVKSEGGQLVLSTDSPPFPGITEPGDFTIGRISGPLIYFAGEVRRDAPTGPVVPGVVIRSRPDALPTSPFAAVTDSLGRFLVADGSLTGPFDAGAAVTSRLDAFDEQFSRTIRREVRGIVRPPAPPGTVVAHLLEPFVLPTRLPPEITDILGDLEPPTVELVIEGPTYLNGQSGVFSPLKVTVRASDNDEVVFVALELDEGAGYSPVVLSPEHTFEITPVTDGLLVFRAQARDRSDNSTFENEWVRIGPIVRVPALLSIDPNVGYQGQNLTVAITGALTRFEQGDSQVSLGSRIATGAVTVASPTQLTANVAIAVDAAVGARRVTVTTDIQIATRPHFFTVTPRCSVMPDKGQQGQTLLVTITCKDTQFVQGVSEVDLGDRIDVSGVQVVNLRQLTATLTIAANAERRLSNPRKLTVTTGSERALQINAFTILPQCLVVPDWGPRGGVVPLPVTITCQSTNFVDGMSTVDLGADITADPVDVASSTQLVTYLTIAANAMIGPRTVTVTTIPGSDSVEVSEGFEVVPAAPCSMVPNTGQQGQPPLSVTITCPSTNFTQGGMPAVDLGAGISVGPPSIVSPTQLRVTVTIAANAAVGTRTATVGPQSIPGGFTVAALERFVFSVPPTGYQGQTLPITVFGWNTSFAQGSQVSFGTGITTAPPTVTDPTTLTVQATISFTAPVGPHTVSVTTGSETAFGQFTVLAMPPPRIVCGAFDGTFDVQFWTPIDRTTANDQTVRLFDSDGNLVPHSLRFDLNDSRIVIVPDQYLRLGARYSVVTDGVNDSDGIRFPATTEPCEIAPPELLSIIGKDDGVNPPRDDVVAINGETVKDIATVGDTVVAVTHPQGSSPGDVGHLHTFQLRFANNGTFEKIETLATVPVRGRPQSLATDATTAYVGNRFLGAIATKAPFVSPVVVGAEPLVFPDTMLGCGLEILTPVCVGFSLYWDAFPQPASNLEVFDLGDVRSPNRLGAAVINSILPDTWDPNTWPNRVEVTPQGIALHNFLNNVEFFSPGAQPASRGIVGQIIRYGEVTPRGPDGRLRTADDLQNEFLDAAFFDGFAVTQVSDGIRVMSTGLGEAHENSEQLAFLPMSGAHGGRMGGVQRFQWGGDQGVDTTSDLAFVTTTDNTLTIFDVTNPRLPDPIGTLPNTFGNMSFDACRGIAYIHGRLGEFQVVDFNDPHNPVELNRPDDLTQAFTVQTSLGRELLGRHVSFNGNANRNGIVYLANDTGVAAVRVLGSSPSRFEARDACRLKLIPERPTIPVGETQVFVPSSGGQRYSFTLPSDSSGGAILIDNGNGTATYTAGPNPGSGVVQVDVFNSPPRTATATPTVIAIRSVEWIEVDPPGDNEVNLTNNPSTHGGGHRIFPDKNTPTGPLNDEVILRVTITPPVENAEIFVSIFDVDDPRNASPRNFGEIQEVGLTLSPPSPSPSLTDPRPPVGPIRLVTTVNGVAEIRLVVSMHAGDNYRAAAALRREFLMDQGQQMLIRPRLPDPIGGLECLCGPVPTWNLLRSNFTGAIQESELLTVWRRLSVEVDAMEPVPLADRASLPADDPVLTDEMRSPKTDALELAFSEAYIDVEILGESDGSNPNAPWKHHFEDVGDLRTYLEGHNGLRGQKTILTHQMEGDYWRAYVIGVYELGFNDFKCNEADGTQREQQPLYDNDPDSGFPVTDGRSYGAGAPLVSLIPMEVIRDKAAADKQDAAAWNSKVVLHEVGHLLRLGHNDLGTAVNDRDVMWAGTSGRPLNFNAKNILVMRALGNSRLDIAPSQAGTTQPPPPPCPVGWTPWN